MTSRWLVRIATIVLATICSAGLFAASTNDLRQYAPFALNSGWLVLGLILVGALVATALQEGTWSAGGMAISAVLGATLYGGAIAAPGTAVPAIQTTLINNGTVQGLAAFLLTLIFGMIGVVGSIVARSMLGRGEL